jgi:hypothetical protein
MKRILFFVLIVAAMISCKDKSEVNTASEPSVEDIRIHSNEKLKIKLANYESARKEKFLQCVTNDDVYNEYLKLPLSNRSAWLVLNGYKICNNNAYTCIYDLHEVLDVTEFNRWVKAHKENEIDIKYYEKDWSEIDKFISKISCYDSYIGFVFEGNSIELKRLKFSTDETCYSKPFFESLKKNANNLDKLYFMKAMVPVIKPSGGVVIEERIVFEIRNSSNIRRFDITHDPTLWLL